MQEDQAPVQHLCEHAQAMIQDLEAVGITPTLDEVVWLNDLARQVENPNGGEHAHLAGAPAKAGSVWLWPLTINADEWLTRALKWFDGDAKRAMYAIAFALANGRKPGAFDSLTGYWSSRWALLKFRRSLNCTQGELYVAISDVMPEQDEVNAIEAWFKAEEREKNNVAEEEVEEINWQDTVAYVTAATGLTSDEVRRLHSKDETLEILHAITKQHLAMAGGGDDRPDPQDPYMIACKREGLVIREIKRLHAEKEESE